MVRSHGAVLLWVYPSPRLGQSSIRSATELTAYDFLLFISVPGNAPHFLESSVVHLNVICYLLPSFLKSCVEGVWWDWGFLRSPGLLKWSLLCHFCEQGSRGPKQKTHPATPCSSSFLWSWDVNLGLPPAASWANVKGSHCQPLFPPWMPGKSSTVPGSLWASGPQSPDI